MNGGGKDTGEEQLFREDLQRSVVAFSTGWLVAANLVGVWLAVLLIRPTWGAILGEWTYGRWMALHLNWQLYGWCSLPMVGLLLKRYLRPCRPGVQQVDWALSLWSLALMLGGVSWLQGETSGKLFLDWVGLPRLALMAAMILLWCLLAFHAFVASWKSGHSPGGNGSVADRILLLALASVPILLYWSTGRKIYPAIDPGTGGPTGASLLGSTLVIVLVLALTPKLLGLVHDQGAAESAFWVWFGVDSAIFLLMHHGNSSHRQLQQIVGLGSLLTWVPLLAWYLQRFDWNPRSRLWLAATLWWWGALVISGFASFLPGSLDRIKFSHALVAHAHLAMAGLLTSMNMLILLHLSVPVAKAASPLLSRRAFFCWQGGLVIQIVSLIWLTREEIADPGLFFVGGDIKGYAARLVGGVLMVGASIYWTTRACRAHCAVRAPILERS
jgi:cytochrome c oxidase cbb3-type subunit 1